MTSSTASPSLLRSAPAHVLHVLRSAVAGVPTLVGRALRAAKERAEAVLRRVRATTSDVGADAEPQPPVPNARPAVSTDPTYGAKPLRIARVLSAVVVVLMAVAAAVGLRQKDLYRDPASVAAMFRGYDLVSLLVATPVLAGASVEARRGSPRAELLWA